MFYLLNKASLIMDAICLGNGLYLAPVYVFYWFISFTIISLDSGRLAKLLRGTLVLEPVVTLIVNQSVQESHSNGLTLADWVKRFL